MERSPLDYQASSSPDMCFLELGNDNPEKKKKESGSLPLMIAAELFLCVNYRHYSSL